ncbi:MAG TPA: hypothetical protein VJT31_12765, partial [Rugosimonospora sp.]|nr:hypothetical protein [Rugosimonospora sp.]
SAPRTAARAAFRAGYPDGPALWDDDEELAARAVPAPRAPADTLDAIETHATRLEPEEQQLLAYAIDEHAPVEIHYMDAQGEHSVRVIEDMELAGAAVEAWCRLREDGRLFMLDRIEGVAPA